MGGIIAAGAAVLVGTGLALATVTGVVQSVQAEPESADLTVLNYGSND